MDRYYSFVLRVDMAGVAGFEPTKCRNQNPVPYRLATPQYNGAREGF